MTTRVSMRFSSWLNGKIRKNLLQSYLWIMLILLPIICTYSYFSTLHNVSLSVKNIETTLVEGVKTGDRVLIEKAVMALKNNLDIHSFELKDKDDYSLLNSKQKSDSKFVNAYFSKQYSLRDSLDEVWGSLNLIWIFNYKILILVLVSSVVLFLGMYFMNRYFISKVTRELIFNFSNLSEQVTNSQPSNLFEEVIELKEIFLDLKESQKRLIVSESLKNEINNKQQILDLSKKLAHDIRSPISTLNIISYQIEDAQLKSLQMTVVDQINQIANDLLNKSKNLQNSEPVCAAHFINDLKCEFDFKKPYYKRNIEFNYNVDELKNVNIEKPLVTVLYRVISNCIVNAVEATNEDAGNISIIITKSSSNQLTIEIKDNGIGISNELLNKLGNEEISSAKSSGKYNSGSGIALFNARKDLKNFSSTLDILSNENIGTTVKIKVPL